METGLLDLPPEILLEICTYLSIRQVHRLKANRRLRAFVDGWAGLDAVMRGRHPLLRQMARENVVGTRTWWRDAEGRRWGPETTDTFTSICRQCCVFFDDKKHGEQRETRVLDHDRVTETRTVFAMGREIGRSKRYNGVMVEATRSNKTVYLEHPRCDLQVDSEWNWVWFTGIGDSGTFLSSILSQGKLKIVVEWSERFYVTVCDHDDLRIEGDAYEQIIVKTQDEKYEVQGFIDLGNATPRADVAVIRSDRLAGEDRLVASVQIEGCSMRVGFEMDGWKETTFVCSF